MPLPRLVAWTLLSSRGWDQARRTSFAPGYFVCTIGTEPSGTTVRFFAVTFSPACGGGGFLLKNPNGFSIDRLSPHALWFARFMSRVTR